MSDRTSQPCPETQKMADGWVAQGNAPGIAIAIAAGDDDPSFAAAGNVAYEGGAPAADPDSLWRLYSMTKAVTAIAAMILVEDGVIAIDDPLSDYFPEFSQMEVLVGDGIIPRKRAAKTPITLRHLMTHTAGMGYSFEPGPLMLPYFLGGINPWQINIFEESIIRPGRAPTLPDFARAVAGFALFAEPGTIWSYSIGLDMLAAVVEVACGDSFQAFVQARILDPLGMDSTCWTLPPADQARLSSSYKGGDQIPVDPRAASIWLTPPSFAYGGAGLLTSARDYDRLLHMLMAGGTLDGATVMKPATIATMMSDLLPAGTDTTQLIAAIGGPTPMGFGAGGYVTLVDDPDTGRGAGTYGWGGFAGTFFWVDPKNQVRCNAMINVIPGPVLAMSTLFSSVYADLTG